MHDINKIRADKIFFLNGWKKRGLEVNLDNILNLDEDLRSTITNLQNLQTQRNEASKFIGIAKQDGDEGRVSELTSNVQGLKDSMHELEVTKANLSKKLKLFQLNL